MKTVGKLTAAVAMALSLATMQQVQAQTTVEVDSNGMGDALIFPVFNGYVDNYFTITNTANNWIQGHLRFRGAAWSGELIDFDVMLSPGDVLVFRVADLDGDGSWEIDQSIDAINFMYTGMHRNCTPDMNAVVTAKNSADREALEAEYEGCYIGPPSFPLVPSASELIAGVQFHGGVMDETSANNIINHHLRIGYIEFIGEAILVGLNETGYPSMDTLLTASDHQYQTDVFNRTGTTAWKWSDAANGFAEDLGLLDVPNVLTGTAFINIPGMPTGLAYNAEAIANFRTIFANHRIDNYRLSVTSAASDLPDKSYPVVPGTNYTPSTVHAPLAAVTASMGDNPTATATDQAAFRAVILHDENGAIDHAVGTSPFGDYVYAFDDDFTTAPIAEDNLTEARISFNNTWGPTLQDGDDYLTTRIVSGTVDIDDWDSRFSDESNSIAEIEEAIRSGGQVFYGFYFDGDNLGASGNLVSNYFAHFPTKFYYGERANFWGLAGANMDISPKSSLYRDRAIGYLLQLQKQYTPQVWDIDEHPMGTVTFNNPNLECISPSTFEDCFSTVPVAEVAAFLFELTNFNIQDIKGILDGNSYSLGRVVFDLYDGLGTADQEDNWPGLMYTFEFDSTAGNIEQWRSLQR